MLGRPIGFDSRMGDGGPIWVDDIENGALTPQPIAMRIIYNGCNCPASRFTGDVTPRNMTIRVVNDPTDTQGGMDYQYNYMEYVYNQDCGPYSIELQNQDPTVDLSSVLTAGPREEAGGRFDYPYT